MEAKIVERTTICKTWTVRLRTGFMKNRTHSLVRRPALPAAIAADLAHPTIVDQVIRFLKVFLKNMLLFIDFLD
jgi:hypothetical protein